MNFRFSLACSHMMMECPRCGFTQPKDQYCASCGLDVDSYAAKPKPFFARLVQNPNVHLSLIGLLIVLIVGYIFYSQRAVVSREVGHLFSGAPLTSRESGDPNAPETNRRSAAKTAAPQVKPEAEEDADAAAEEVPLTKSADATTAAPAPAAATKIEIGHWEVPRDTLNALVATGEKVGESNGGRAYLFKDGTKAAETITNSGHRTTAGRTIPLENLQQPISVETPPSTPESFQFGLYFQVNKSEEKGLGVKWESTIVLPPPEAMAGGMAVPPDSTAGSRQPVVKALTETQFGGSASPTTAQTLILVFDPPNRALREDAVIKAGYGPWTIFSSPDFRGGATDWVVLVQLK